MATWRWFWMRRLLRKKNRERRRGVVMRLCRRRQWSHLNCRQSLCPQLRPVWSCKFFCSLSKKYHFDEKYLVCSFRVLNCFICCFILVLCQCMRIFTLVDGKNTLAWVLVFAVECFLLLCLFLFIQVQNSYHLAGKILVKVLGFCVVSSAFFLASVYGKHAFRLF